MAPPLPGYLKGSPTCLRSARLNGRCWHGVATLFQHGGCITSMPYAKILGMLIIRLMDTNGMVSNLLDIRHWHVVVPLADRYDLLVGWDGLMADIQYSPRPVPLFMWWR